MAERSRSWNEGCWTTSTFWIGASSPDSLGGRLLHLGRHLVGHVLQPVRRRLLPRLEHPAQLVLDVLLVVGQAVGQRGQLLPDDVADAAQEPQGEDDRQDDRGGAGQAASLQEADRRRQGEAQEHREGQRLEDLAREVHEGDDGEDQHRELERIGQRGSLASGGHGRISSVRPGSAARRTTTQLSCQIEQIGIKFAIFLILEPLTSVSCSPSRGVWSPS